MEDGVLISDEFTNPIKRREMMEKRMRKVAGIEASIPPPELWGPRDAEVTLIGWGSTKGVIEDSLAGSAAWRCDSRGFKGFEAHLHR
jgi:2-oxoglutarate ferredoxin oxidoreductase subunit alpha